MTTETWTKPIFFDLDTVENIAEEEATVPLDYAPPVILPENTEFEKNYPSAAQPEFSITQSHKDFPPQTYPSNAGPLWWLVGSLGLLLIFMLLVDTYHFIAQQYHTSLFLGTLFLSLILSIASATFILSWRSYKNLQNLRSVAVLQQEGHQLLASEDYGKAIPYLNKITHLYTDKPDIKERLERFYLTFNDSHHDREVCSLFSNLVLKEIDQQAYAIITQRSKEAALMVMLSQIALLDSLLMLWRNVRMIRDIATLYGGKPGFLATLSLIKGVFQNIIYAGVSEVAADSVTEIMSSSVLSFMSAQAAQGVGSGVLTARLGLYTMQTCRPLPFLEAEKPRLKEIRWEIMSSLKRLFEQIVVKDKKM